MSVYEWVIGLAVLSLPVLLVLFFVVSLVGEAHKPHSMFEHDRQGWLIVFMLNIPLVIFVTYSISQSGFSKVLSFEYTPLADGLIALISAVNIPLTLYLMFRGMRRFLASPTPPEITVPTPVETPPAPPATMTGEALFKELKLPPSLSAPVLYALNRYFGAKPPATLIAELPNYHSKTNPIPSLANAINNLGKYLPPAGLIGGSGGTTWGQMLDNALSDQEQVFAIQAALSVLPEPLKTDLRAIQVPIAIPEELRTHNMMVVATVGFGKSELIKRMVMDDVEAGRGVVVIDSQNDLINSLATRIPLDRLTLIDPIECPPPLNIFEIPVSNTETHIEAKLPILEYVFGAFDTALTGKQRGAYRQLSTYMMAGGHNLPTMRDLLQDLDNPQIHEWLLSDVERFAKLLGDDNMLSFFREFTKKRGDYAETKQQLLTRITTVLGSRPFRTMLGADKCMVDMQAELAAGRVVLVNTQSATLGLGANIIGRFFLKSVDLAMRQGSRPRVNLYVDEFADYSDDDLAPMFTQGRKYGLGILTAFQTFSNIPANLAGVMHSTTSIKFAGGVSASDRASLAREMNVDADFIANAKRGNFAAWFRDMGHLYYPVEYGGMERRHPEITPLSKVHEAMRVRFTPPPPPPEDDRTFHEKRIDYLGGLVAEEPDEEARAAGRKRAVDMLKSTKPPEKKKDKFNPED